MDFGRLPSDADAQAFLHVVNSEAAKKLKCAWDDLKDEVLDLALLATDLRLEGDDLVADEGEGSDFAEKIQRVKDQVGTMVAARSACRPLRPSENRESVMAAANETVAMLDAVVEPRVGLLFSGTT